MLLIHEDGNTITYMKQNQLMHLAKSIKEKGIESVHTLSGSYQVKGIYVGNDTPTLMIF